MIELEKKKLVKIRYKNRNLEEIELNVNNTLNTTRNELSKSIGFPFTFLNDDEKEISYFDEISSNLGDILDGKFLYIKKKLKPRTILGEKIYSNNELDYYLYPKANLSDIQKQNSSNILIIGETGVGKSTWIHSLLNHLEEIDIDENLRYILFDEKKKQLEYESKYGKKTAGCSVTDKPEIYEISSTKLYNNCIRLIDTTGFGDTRGIEYDNRIIKDIKNLLDNCDIDNLKAICLIFKATETRAHDRLKYIMKQVFSLFSEDIKKNFIIIFNFVDSKTDLPVIKVLKSENLPFIKIFGDIENIPKFYFNNQAYFSDDKINYEYIYEENNKNFNNFLNYLSNLEPVSLINTKKIIQGRIHIREEILKINEKIEKMNNEIMSMMKAKIKLVDIKTEDIFNNHNNRPRNLFCKKHCTICKDYYHWFFKSCRECSCDLRSHKKIVNYADINDEKYKYLGIFRIFSIARIKDEENKLFIKSYNKIHLFLLNSLIKFKKLIFENKKINKISLEKADENLQMEYINDILNEIIKDKNKLTDFLKDNFKVCGTFFDYERKCVVDKFLNSLFSNY